MTDLHTWSLIAVIAFVTAVIRFLPFILFNGNRKTPPIINKLGKMLPYAIMGMLVVYCLKGINFAGMSGYMPSVIACLVVAVLHIWKKNTLISIVCGTVCYMVLVQMVF